MQTFGHLGSCPCILEAVRGRLRGYFNAIFAFARWGNLGGGGGGKRKAVAPLNGGMGDGTVPLPPAAFGQRKKRRKGNAKGKRTATKCAGQPMADSLRRKSTSGDKGNHSHTMTS